VIQFRVACDTGILVCPIAVDGKAIPQYFLLGRKMERNFVEQWVTSGGITQITQSESHNRRIVVALSDTLGFSALLPLSASCTRS